MRWNHDDPPLVDPLMAARRADRPAAAAAPVRRGATPTRRRRGAASTRSARSTPEVARARRSSALAKVGVGVLVVVGLWLIPTLLRVDQVIKATAIVVFAIIGLSLVVLTGWAGQISLGQMGFVAIGAAVERHVHVRVERRPHARAARRRRRRRASPRSSSGSRRCGCAGCTSPSRRSRSRSPCSRGCSTSSSSTGSRRATAPRAAAAVRPHRHRRRRPRYYLYTVVVAVARLRRRARHPPQPHRPGDRRHPRERAGRAELRRAGRAGQAHGVHDLRRRSPASAAGCSSTSTRRSASPRYSPGESLDVFVAAVVGGLGSVCGGVLGAVYLRGTQWFITAPEWQFLSTGVGVLLVLLILPGGLGVARSCGCATSYVALGARRPADRRRRDPRRPAPTSRTAADHELEQRADEPVRGARAPPDGVAARRLRRRAGLPAGHPVRPQRRRRARPHRVRHPAAEHPRRVRARPARRVLGLVALAGVAALALQVPIAQFADRSQAGAARRSAARSCGRASPA